MSIHQLGYIRAEATPAAFAEWESYLTDLLIFASVRVEDGEIRVQVDRNASRVTIAQGPSDDILAMGWDAGTRAEWLELLERAKEWGLDPQVADETTAANRQVLELFSVSDPNGMGHEIFYGPMTDDPRNLDRRMIGAFLAGDVGIGHAAVLTTTDSYRASIEFFRDFLGLVESGRRESDPAVATPISMFRCNARQHSLAVVPWRKEGGKRLAHFAIEFTQLDYLGRSYDAAHARNVVKGSLGRHQADNTVSYYAATPSGYEVEIGWDSRMVEADAGTELFRAYKTPSIWGHHRTDNHDH
ncbi:MAG TPA: VOC family protein [Pseudolysinimonas sp.]|nr:VOC family protein [Pseudolysinimonas sp.]